MSIGGAEMCSPDQKEFRVFTIGIEFSASTPLARVIAVGRQFSANNGGIDLLIAYGGGVIPLNANTPDQKATISYFESLADVQTSDRRMPLASNDRAGWTP